MRSVLKEVACRPRLAEVLGVLTGSPPVRWEPGMVLKPAGLVKASGELVPWVVRDARDGLETLVSRGVLPDGWEHDPLRGFVSTATMSNGASLEVPESIPPLVSWSSIGRKQINRGEELCREVSRRLVAWGLPLVERVVWWRVPDWSAYRLSPWGGGKDGGTDPPWWPQSLQDAWVIHRRTELSKLQSYGKPFSLRWYKPRMIWMLGNWNLADTVRDKPCPFGPVLDLHALRLSLHSITSSTLTIAMPPIGDPS